MTFKETIRVFSSLGNVLLQLMGTSLLLDLLLQVLLLLNCVFIGKGDFDSEFAR